MKLPNDIIKQIAEELDSGMICYLNKETKEIKSIVDADEVYTDIEPWQEEIDKIENNREQYIRIDKMPSSVAFQIMVDFTEEISNQRIKERLIYALNKNKPFRNFKYEVDYHGSIRQKWFNFKAIRYEVWVVEFLEYIMDDENEEEVEQPRIWGYFNDDGTPLNPNLQPLPNLCLICKKKADPNEEILCNLNRLDQQGEEEFKCGAYEKKR